MTRRKWSVIGVMSVTIAMFGGASVSNAAEPMRGDSLVLVGEKPGALLAEKIDPASVVVRSTYLPDAKDAVVYEAGRDYTFDAKTGTISRTAGSRIPDFSTNILFGKKDFNHVNFPGYGNLKHTIYVDYKYDDDLKLKPPTKDVAAMLPKTLEKLKSGKPLKLMAFGDSIAAGGEASTVDLQFPLRFIEVLKKRHPKADISFENGSTGGDNTPMGLSRIQEKVLTRSPDLVLIAFGMNDHNVGGVPTDAFKENLKTIATQIREKTGAEVILLSSFPPNPDWHFSANRMELYAEATKAAAEDLKAPYADLYSVWMKVLKRKDAPSLLANNINHPNDFGHWLYVQALSALEF